VQQVQLVHKDQQVKLVFVVQLVQRVRLDLLQPLQDQQAQLVQQEHYQQHLVQLDLQALLEQLVPA
jgi:hypothetical protein